MILMSLNPCCSGQWSSTLWHFAKYQWAQVLILVVVDNGLVRENVQLNSQDFTS